MILHCLHARQLEFAKVLLRTVVTDVVLAIANEHAMGQGGKDVKLIEKFYHSDVLKNHTRE